MRRTNPAACATTPYTLTLLPLIMPLAEGARVRVCVGGDDTGLVSSRSRLECVGKETIEVDGTPTDA